MVKNEENYGMCHTTSNNVEKLMNVDFLERAANSIVRIVQLKSVGEEIRILSANSNGRIRVNKSSKLYKFDPFLDSDGLLRVGGRLGKSRLSHSEAHPLVLPKQSSISKQSYDGAMKMLPIVEEE